MNIKAMFIRANIQRSANLKFHLFQFRIHNVEEKSFPQHRPTFQMSICILGGCGWVWVHPICTDVEQFLDDSFAFFIDFHQIVIILVFSIDYRTQDASCISK